MPDPKWKLFRVGKDLRFWTPALAKYPHSVIMVVDYQSFIEVEKFLSLDLTNIWKFLTFSSLIAGSWEVAVPACWSGKTARDPEVHWDTAGRVPWAAHVLWEEEHRPVWHDCRSPSAGKGLAENARTSAKSLTLKAEWISNHSKVQTSSLFSSLFEKIKRALQNKSVCHVFVQEVSGFAGSIP